jgi:tetratricopeptide (TPR) repeat protein
MKTCHFIILALFIMLPACVFAQKTDEAKKLVDQGIALNDSGKYDQAIAKYKQAMLADSTYPNSYYESGYTLFSSGKEKEAIPYLEKLLHVDPNAGGGYDMLGSIYDDANQPDKAIEYFKKGIEVNPEYQRLHFNIAITYYKIGKFAESENAAIDAIKLDPKHASSHRIYGMALYAQHKESLAILPLCNFLMLQPKSNLAGPIYNLIDSTFKQQSSKNIVLTTDDIKGKDISPLALSKISLNLAVITKDSLMKRGDMKPVDQMMIQLKMLFTFTGNISKKMPDSRDFFWKYYADYFSKLAQSDNMLTFTHYITLNIYNSENVAWFKEHDTSIKDFSKWLDDTKRSF